MSKTTDKLPMPPEHRDTRIVRRMTELAQQRDELLAALRDIAGGLTYGQKDRGETLQDIARAAIAKAEGRTS